MLKRNLIIIAITCLALMLANNAFGQITKQKIKAKKPSGLITQVEFPNAQAKGNNPVSSDISKRKYKPSIIMLKEKESASGEFPNLIRAKTKTTKAAGNLYDWHEDFIIKKPRKTENYNLGDTATHEKRRKRRN